MRVPSDLSQPRPRSIRRYQAWILAAVIAFVLLLLVLQGLANFYTNYLWYRSTHFTMVWRSMVETKLTLAAVFSLVFFVACWMSLWVVDRIAPRALLVSPELELVRRYQSIVGRHTVAVRTLVSLVIALIVGSSASSQWQHWLMYRHATSFPATDPQFHKNVGFYIFKLPFLSFLVDWSLVALLVLLIVTLIGHYLNGGLRFQGPPPRIDPRVTAQLSLILAVMALVRAAGYFYVDRYGLDLATDGYVNGAGYTDVHVRLPAIELLAVVALAAFVVLVFNIYQRSLALPAIAAGLWALIALAVGVVFPAAVQAFQVTPAQSSLELPYIQRNIDATRSALGIAAINEKPFPGNQDLNAGVIDSYASTLNNLPLWDPAIAEQTYQKLQVAATGFTLAGLSLDRYRLHGVLTPTVIGVRQVALQDLPTQTWVNTHLQYTHGYGAILSPANTSTSGGNPSFIVGNVPPQSAPGAPVIHQPAVYFGVGQTGYVVAPSKQAEVDYSTANGVAVSSHYSGPGGVPIGSFWTRAAFALRFHDFNLLVSKLVTPKSRLLFVQDVRARVAKVAPFLKVDSNPYAVIDNGHIDWVVDAYTSSSYYPYAQQADTSVLPAGSGLAAGGFNYARNSVKVVVDSYTGMMTFYAVDQSDPILQAWEATFPGMFKPLSAMDETLRQHLRYPQDLLMVQSNMFGRYHLTQPATFYSANNAWQLAPTSGTGSPAQALPTDAYGNVLRFTPEYEALQLPGASQTSFNLLEPLDPRSQNDSIQSLAAFVVAASDFAHYGQLTAYVTPTGHTTQGPAVVNARINSNSQISSYITLLDRQGSVVSLGQTLVVPIADSLVYVRPLYVSSSQNPFPELTRIIVVYGNQVAMNTTLKGALVQVFGAAAAGVSPGGSSAAIPAAVRQLLDEASKQYQAALVALRNEDLGTYSKDVAAAAAAVDAAQKLLKSVPTTSSASTSSTSFSTATGAKAGSSGGGARAPASGAGGSGSGSGGSGGTTPTTAPGSNSPSSAQAPPGTA